MKPFSLFSKILGGNQSDAIPPKKLSSSRATSNLQSLINGAESASVHAQNMVLNHQGKVIHCSAMHDDFISVSVARKTSAPPNMSNVQSTSGHYQPMTYARAVSSPAGTSVARPTCPPPAPPHSCGITRLPGVDYSSEKEQLGPLWEVRDSNNEAFEFNVPGFVVVNAKDLLTKKEHQKN